MSNTLATPTQGFVVPADNYHTPLGWITRLFTAAFFLADTLLSSLQASVAAVQATANAAVSVAGLQAGSSTYAADTGTANTYAVALSPAPAALVAGLSFLFKVKTLNTTASTLAVNSLTAKAITKNGATALSGGELVAGAIVQVTYDGTQFQLV